MVNVGEVAPDFQLPLHTEEEFRLSACRGKKNVILYFYPSDAALGPKGEGPFAKQLEAIEALDGYVVGINGDDLETHQSFARKFRLGFVLASDERLEVCRNYRAVWMRGLGIRKITYIIDKRGVVRAKMHHELLVDKHWESVLRILRELRDEEEVRTYNRKYMKL